MMSLSMPGRSNGPITRKSIRNKRMLVNSASIGRSKRAKREKDEYNKVIHKIINMLISSRSEAIATMICGTVLLILSVISACIIAYELRVQRELEKWKEMYLIFDRMCHTCNCNGPVTRAACYPWRVVQDKASPNRRDTTGRAL